MEPRPNCCSINYSKVKTALETWRAQLRAGSVEQIRSGPQQEPVSVVPVEVLCSKIDESVSEVTFPLLPGKFALRCDEQAEPVYYGKGTAPQPLDFFLAGVAMCMASIYAEGGADLGIPVEMVEIRVRGELDMNGILDTDGKGYGPRSGFAKVTYTVNIQSSEAEGRIAELIRRVERCCPAHNALMHPTAGEFHYTLNGKVLAV